MFVRRPGVNTEGTQISVEIVLDCYALIPFTRLVRYGVPKKKKKVEFYHFYYDPTTLLAYYVNFL